jgi:hypothetical protein
LADPGSICAKNLRAKYFPDGDLLNCKLKKGSSYSWQSIWAGIQTFKKGAIWRVGDGKNINIWDDCWIPSSPNRKVMTPRGNIFYTKVLELINSEDGSWDEEILNLLFSSVDVQWILNIPLSRRGMDDFAAWHFNKNGIFTVKSAYYVEWEYQHGRKIQRSSLFGSSRSSPIWSQRGYQQKLRSTVEIVDGSNSVPRDISK